MTAEKLIIHHEGEEKELMPIIHELTKSLKEKGLEEKDAQELRDLAISRVMKINNRKQRELGDKKIPNQSIALASTEVLAQINQLADQILIDKAREQERLNPALLSKSGARKEFVKKREELKKDKADRYLVLAAIDLDDFKTLNDGKGHKAGDAALKSFGQALEKAMRPEDKAIHFSGDEFGFILDINLDEDISEKTDITDLVEKILKRMVSEAQKNTKRSDGKSQELSVGYSVVSKNQIGSYEDFLHQADQASAMSKILKIMEAQKGNDIKSSERVLKDEDVKNIKEKYSSEEIAKAKALRGIKREVNALLEVFRPTDVDPTDVDAKTKVDAMAEIAPCFDSLLKKITAEKK